MSYDIQADSFDYVAAIKRMMNIQTKKNKPHKKQTSIAHEFIVSFIIIISSVTIVYIGRI